MKPRACALIAHASSAPVVAEEDGRGCGEEGGVVPAGPAAEQAAPVAASGGRHSELNCSTRASQDPVPLPQACPDARDGAPREATVLGHDLQALPHLACRIDKLEDKVTVG